MTGSRNHRNCQLLLPVSFNRNQTSNEIITVTYPHSKKGVPEFSAILSFVRTVILQITFIFVLPRLWGLDGIWWSAVLAEGLAAALSIVCILAYRKKYKYM